MKVKALLKFDDLLENTTRNIGDIFEVSKKRYDEILTKGGKWVEVVEDIEDVDLSKMKRKELEDIARQKGIPDEEIKNAQNKDALIELLEGY